jgi:hypothetical protein
MDFVKWEKKRILNFIENSNKLVISYKSLLNEYELIGLHDDFVKIQNFYEGLQALIEMSIDNDKKEISNNSSNFI